MDKNLNQKEAKKRRESTEIKIEDKIHNMLNEVMEEKTQMNHLIMIMVKLMMNFN